MEIVPVIDELTGGLKFEERPMDFLKMREQQILLKQKMKKDIFDQFPLTGFYKGETKQQGEYFIKYLLDYFEKQEGPRADKINEIKQQMDQNKQTIEPLLKEILGLDYDLTNIKDIENKLVSFYPCTNIKDLEVNLDFEKRLMEDISNLENQNSMFYRKIYNGLYKKSQDENNSKQQIEGILNSKKQMLLEKQKEIQNLKQELSQDQKYLDYKKLMSYIDPLLKQWQTVDQQVGFESNENGQGLEQIMMGEHQLLDLILNDINKQRCEVDIHFNVNWNNCPGEIDIVVLQKQKQIQNQNQQNREVLCLIEIKARCFDLYYGFLQSGPHRDHNKQQIIIENEIIDVPFNNLPCFIITCFPKQQYKLGFESKLKLEIQRYTIKRQDKSQPVDTELMYKNIKELYEDDPSPQEFFQTHSDIIYIIP